MVLSVLEKLDIFLLLICIIFISFYLYKNRSKIKKEGILYLYKTSWGLKLIQKTGNKYKKTLYILSYISIFISYLLMISIIYFFIKIVFDYITKPEIVQIIKAPPIAPVIPYFPKLFGLSSMFPNFYGIYFVISIAIVAIVHEFAHGIFAQRYKINIKTTGFAFLKFFPAIFGAFVEQDEKQMTKRTKFEQMSVLSAGVFANILVMFLFIILLLGFFSIAFTPAGAVFHDYSYSKVYASDINLINNKSFDNPNYTQINDYLNKTKEIEIISDNKENYVGFKDFNLDEKGVYFYLYDNAPAINSKLKGRATSFGFRERIVNINSNEIKNNDDFSNELLKYKPEDEIKIGVKSIEGYEEFNITLNEHPLNKSRAYLGVVSIREGSYIINEISHYFNVLNTENLYVKQGTFYEPIIPGFSEFIYYLFWWIIILNFSVALINMLPVGIFDGGRFFYLTIWGITKNEKIAEKAFKFMTMGFLFLLIVLMVFWLIGILFY